MFSKVHFLKELRGDKQLSLKNVAMVMLPGRNCKCCYGDSIESAIKKNSGDMC